MGAALVFRESVNLIDDHLKRGIGQVSPSHLSWLSSTQSALRRGQGDCSGLVNWRARALALVSPVRNSTRMGGFSPRRVRAAARFCALFLQVVAQWARSGET